MNRLRTIWIDSIRKETYRLVPAGIMTKVDGRMDNQERLALWQEKRNLIHILGQENKHG